MLWLALYLPLLPVESAAAAAADTPQVVVHNRSGQHSVTCLNNAAAAFGIDPDMPLTAARSLCQDLVVIEHDPTREQQALNGLALWAMHFSSKVSVHTSHPNAAHGLLIEIGASLTLFGGLERLHAEVLSSLGQLGYSAHSGIAPIAAAAWLLALEQREQRITEHSALRPRLLQLPLALLPLSSKQQATLQRLGLRRIGDCLRLPRDGLTRRLGPDVLDGIDRALGNIPEVLTFYQPPQQFSAQILLPEPVIQVEALLFILKRLLGQLSGFLRTRDAAAQRLQVSLIKPFAPIETLHLTLLQPSRDADHLFALWREKLERHRLDAAVEGLELQVPTLLAITPQSNDLLGSSKTNGDSFLLTLERLKNRLGDDVIHQPLCVADHRPEYRGIQVSFPARSAPAEQPDSPRPLWLLRTPQALAHNASGAPLLRGPLTLLSGPERIEGGWWDDGDQRRDYYIAHNSQQQRLWIYRALGAEPQWFLHGFFS